jgi:hypothetical protein
MDKDGYHGYYKRSMKVEGPLHVVCQCDKCKAQPQRWVGLTDEEMKDALASVDAETKRLPPGFRDFAQAIEAKLKQKNNGITEKGQP